MADGDVLLARIVATFDGEPIINTFAFVDVGSGAESGVATQQALNSELATALGLNTLPSLWLDGLNIQYVLKSLDVVDIVPGTAPMYSGGYSGAGGVDDDDAMPPNDALCITWRSAFKGPSGRGRVYLTGFSEGAANGGYWEAGTQLYAGLVANALIDNFGEAGTGSFRFVVLHRMAGGEPIVPPEQKPVMAYTVHNEVRSIGRRAVGRRIRRRRVVGP